MFVQDYPDAQWHRLKPDGRLTLCELSPPGGLSTWPRTTGSLPSDKDVEAVCRGRLPKRPAGLFHGEATPEATPNA